MTRRLQLMTRVAVFAALVFVFSYFSVTLYNFNPAFFIVFMAGYVWGVWPGIGVGVIGFFLYSNFNPYGPAPLPVLAAQLVGVSFTPILGSAVSRMIHSPVWDGRTIFILALAGFISGLSYHIVVDIVDALIFQPFVPRLIGGLFFSLITIVSNSIIFPLLFPILVYMRNREKDKLT